MPLVVRYSDIPGLEPTDIPEARDVGVSEFLSVSSDLWGALTPEFRAEKFTLYETFPGEHLGGKLVPGGTVRGESNVTPALLRRLSRGTVLAPEDAGSSIRVHMNHSMEVEGLLEVEGVPPALGVLQLNLYRAWAEGTGDWQGAGDAVFEVLKTGTSRFDGLWGLTRQHTNTMIPILKRWVEEIARASHPRGQGRHRIRWAALTETGAADDPPTTGAFMLYRARTLGRPSLLTSNIKAEAGQELSELLGEAPDPFKRAMFHQAIDHEVDAMTLAHAFPATADRFQGAALAVYGQGGSEYFVFRDPDAPRKAARELVHAVRPKLRSGVLDHMGEGREWDAELSRLVPSTKPDKASRSKLSGWQ